MTLRQVLLVGLLAVGTVMAVALPGTARSAQITYEVNLRSGPSTTANRIDGLPKGTPLQVLKVIASNDRYHAYWYYVRSTGRLKTQGWVAGSYVSFDSSNQRYGTLAGQEGDVINIRSGPGLHHRIVHTGSMGDLVSVGQSKFVTTSRDSRAGYDWYPVTYPNGATGWVRSDLINLWPKDCIITCSDN